MAQISQQSFIGCYTNDKKIHSHLTKKNKSTIFYVCTTCNKLAHTYYFCYIFVCESYIHTRQSQLHHPPLPFTLSHSVSQLVLSILTFFGFLGETNTTTANACSKSCYTLQLNHMKETIFQEKLKIKWSNYSSLFIAPYLTCHLYNQSQTSIHITATEINE